MHQTSTAHSWAWSTGAHARRARSSSPRPRTATGPWGPTWLSTAKPRDSPHQQSRGSFSPPRERQRPCPVRKHFAKVYKYQAVSITVKILHTDSFPFLFWVCIVCLLSAATGDDQSVSIQMRGGPEPLMVTGWMQIMSLDPSYIGDYHCIASNSEGKAFSKASVGVYKNELWLLKAHLNTIPSNTHHILFKRKLL